jgi:segregation and condensation protein A
LAFEIKLPLFQGPFDLLLFFIERDELDINDIPISTITNEFLSYLKDLEKLNIEVASEFILVASTLMSIKARMLVPRPEIDEQGTEIDPRNELVQRLLEYKKYKSVVDELANLENTRALKEPRGNVIQEIKKLAEINNVEAEMQHLDLYKLLKVYQKVLDRYKLEQSKPIHQVVQYPYTISQQKALILHLVESKDKVAFTDIIQENSDKIAIIYNFLSILELLQLNLISIHIGEGFNNFWIQQQRDKSLLAL